jgi:hypothetical protein
LIVVFIGHFRISYPVIIAWTAGTKKPAAHYLHRHDQSGFAYALAAFIFGARKLISQIGAIGLTVKDTSRAVNKTAENTADCFIGDRCGAR